MRLIFIVLCDILATLWYLGYRLHRIQLALEALLDRIKGMKS